MQASTTTQVIEESTAEANHTVNTSCPVTSYAYCMHEMDHTSALKPNKANMGSLGRDHAR